MKKLITLSIATFAVLSLVTVFVSPNTTKATLRPASSISSTTPVANSNNTSFILTGTNLLNKRLYVYNMSVSRHYIYWYNLSSNNAGTMANVTFDNHFVPVPGVHYKIGVGDNNESRLSPLYDFTVSGTSSAMFIAVQSTAGGSVSIFGVNGNIASVTNGSSTTVIATSTTGYTFSSWTEGDSVVSASSSYTFTVSGSRTLVAHFIRNGAHPHTITVQTTTGGTVFIDGAVGNSASINDGLPVTVIATSTTGYIFSNWTRGGVVVSASSSYTFIVSDNRILVAHFTRSQNVSDMSGYSLTASSTVVSGAPITVYWSAPSSRRTHGSDWVALYKIGASNTSYGAWTYTRGCFTNCKFTTRVPSLVGSYEFRYLLDGGYTSATSSNTIVVSPLANSIPPSNRVSNSASAWDAIKAFFGF